jgi:hypothetical protein
MSVEKKTLGQHSIESATKETGTRNVMEIAGAILSDYDKNVMEALEAGRKKYTAMDFYIVVLSKRERLMDNVLRNLFFVRETCPTPNNEQAVYRYDYKNDLLDFVWIVPDDETCRTYIMNKHLVDPAEYELLQFILDFNDGTLFKLALALNGELSLLGEK